MAYMVVHGVYLKREQAGDIFIYVGCFYIFASVQPVDPDIVER